MSRNILNPEQLEQFNEWIADDNAIKIADDIWIEQTTQYQKQFTTDELKQFFKKEYLSFGDGGSTSNNQSFDYRLLSRLQSDNDYYLGAGNRSERQLWAGSVDEQIKEMKSIWHKLRVKPEWLSMEDILEYETKMKNKYSDGGSIKQQNYAMIQSDNKAIMHHSKELNSVLKTNKTVPAWALALVNQSSQNLSNVTHYLEGSTKYADGGVLPQIYGKDVTFLDVNGNEQIGMVQDMDDNGAEVFYEERFIKIPTHRIVKFDTGGSVNSGLSWHQDRARHNKSENYEVPISERKRFDIGGSLYENFVVTATGISNKNKEDLINMDVKLDFQGVGYYLYIKTIDKEKVLNYLIENQIDFTLKDDDKYGQGGGLKLLKVGNKYLYKFNDTKYKIIAIGTKQVALIPLIGTKKRNWIVSKAVLQKWVQSGMMQKIK